MTQRLLVTDLEGVLEMVGADEFEDLADHLNFLVVESMKRVNAQTRPDGVTL